MALIDNQNSNIDDKSEHILVGLSSAPSNAKIVQTAAKMARAFKGSFTAIYVKTPNSELLSAEDKERLQNNITMAEQLGATVATVYGEDVSFQIAEYARFSGITKIVVGRSSVERRKLFGKPSLTEQLIMTAPNIDIYIIPDSTANLSEQKTKIFGKPRIISIIKDFSISLIILAIVTLFGYLFYYFGFTDANIITIYILGVLITSVITNSKLCWVLSAFLSVLVFNFFFTDPKFTFFAYDKGYPVTFGVMLLASLIVGITADKMKNQAKQSSRAAYRTKILFDANQLIQKAKTDEEIIDVTAEQLKKLLKRDMIVYLADSKVFHYSFAGAETCEMSDKFAEITKFVVSSNQKAGAQTELFADEKYIYLPISANEKVYGTVAICINENPIESFDNSIVQSVIGECALALESYYNAKEKELAAVLAKNEQLRANLLRAISHDLRTPLTAISGNASNLISNGDFFDEKTKKTIYNDIYDDSMWLINLVENLLSVTRLEEGKMNINFSTELVDEVIAEAIKHIRVKSKGQKINVINNDDLLLAKMDARLIVQVIINLVDNALKYTTEKSTITITAKKSEDKAVISIADDGDGITDEQKSKVFEMFYTGANKIADSRRSLGLGLALCKSIVNAHGGEIWVSDNKPHGAIFTFTLPIGEVQIDE